jgi:hypothetical protein
VTTPTIGATSASPDPAVGPDLAGAARIGAAAPDVVGDDAPSAPQGAPSASTGQNATPGLMVTPGLIGTPGEMGTLGSMVTPGLVGMLGPNGEQERGTTAAQLRRFIKSRPYVPMHELRRRFELNGDCDDVVAIETPGGRCYIGLPEREGRFMGDLVRQGEVGIELGHDPEVAIVVGVFPMRPVGR